MITYKSKRIFDIFLIALILGVAYIGVLSGNYFLVFFSLIFLATRSVVPNRNPLLLWPVGLLAVIVAAYAGYWIMWLTGVAGVSKNSSRIMFLVVIGFFGCVSIWKSFKSKSRSTSLTVVGSLVPLVMGALPLTLLIIASMRWENDPVRLIAGFVAGGDHNAHNGITHALLSWSGRSSLSSPVQVYSYPNGIHFFIANLVALSSSGVELSTLVQELRMGAWFEMVQLAAFCQLAIVVFMTGAKGSGIRRSLFIPPIVFVFASMDNFVGHLFWSGFTTSLAMTWLLLIPFVLPWSKKNEEVDHKIQVSWILWCGFLGYASWIVYQPYAIPFAVSLLVLTFLKVIDGRQFFNSAWLRKFLQRIFLSSIGVLTFVIAVMPYVIQGKKSPAVSSLLLDGATSRPFFYTVSLWAVVALWGLRPKAASVTKYVLDEAIPLALFIGLLALTSCMIFIVILSSESGLLNQPYYTTKMLWIVLFISIPIALNGIFGLFDEFLSERDLREKSGYSILGFCCILLVPLVMGRAPVAAVTHGSVDWFAKGLMGNFHSQGDKVMAFASGDVLGSHVSNLALRSSSSVVVPVDIGLSNNVLLICKFANKEKVSFLYTSGNGRAEMMYAGCRSNIRYVVDGELISEVTPQYFGIPIGEVVNLSSIGSALQFMKPGGVLPYSAAGNFGTGYGSKIVFSLPEKLEIPKLQFDFVSTIDGPVDKNLKFSVNGIEILAVTANVGKIQRVDLPLPSGAKGDTMEITIDCSWNETETKAIVPGATPPACLKFLGMRLQAN